MGIGGGEMTEEMTEVGIEVTRSKRKPRTMGDIEIGQWLLGEVQNYTGLFIKVYDGLIFVNNPDFVWDSKLVVINDYTPVKKVTINVELAE
jgi:hypothetical protein